MAEITQTSDSLSRRDARLTGQAIARSAITTRVVLAGIEHQAEVEAAKTHAIGYVGQQALHAVSMVSQLEDQLGKLCPLAVTRLQGPRGHDGPVHRPGGR